MVLNYMQDWNPSEITILAPKACSFSLCAWKVIGSFDEDICTFGYFPQLN